MMKHVWNDVTTKVSNMYEQVGPSWMRFEPLRNAHEQDGRDQTTGNDHDASTYLPWMMKDVWGHVITKISSLYEHARPSSNGFELLRNGHEKDELIEDLREKSNQLVTHSSGSDLELSRSQGQQLNSIKEDEGTSSNGLQYKGIYGSKVEDSNHLLSTKQLVGITFFVVAGGPFGFEAILQTWGPKLMVVGLFMFPILWSVPLAMLTAEMSCMIPESGGHVLWVYRAFGPFWAFVNSCFAFACALLDNAMYPALFVDYLSTLVYEGKNAISYGWSVVLKVLLILSVTTLNILGVNIVGSASIMLASMVLAPFAIMCLMGIFRMNFKWIKSPIPNGFNWGKFISVLVWNTSGFDAAGTCASEVRNPGESYPRAMRISVMLLVAMYALPALIGFSVIPDPSKWKNGTYMMIAKTIGGHFLEGLVGFSAALSALGLLLTRLCTNSRIIYGMAQVEMMPHIFTKLHHVYATPWVAILGTSLCTLLLCFFNFYDLVEADMLFYGLSTLLKFSSLVQLRFTEPDVFRPYQVPLGNITLLIVIWVPLLMCIMMIYFASDHSHGIGLIGATLVVLGYISKELFAQHGLEEAIQQRMQQVQQNLDKMQNRINVKIAKEQEGPLQQLSEIISHD